MSHADLDLQEAIFAALSGDSTLSGFVTGIFDGVPVTAQTPYLTIGEATSSDWSTKTFAGQRHRITVHAYLDRESRAEMKPILARVYDLLHGQKPPIAGHRLVSLRFAFSEIFVDPDRRRVHGVMRFTALTQAAS